MVRQSTVALEMFDNHCAVTAGRGQIGDDELTAVESLGTEVELNVDGGVP